MSIPPPQLFWDGVESLNIQAGTAVHVSVGSNNATNG